MTRIVIPMVAPSPNELRRKFRNVHAYRKLREAWEHALAFGVESSAARQALTKQASELRMRVGITFWH